ncbi:hypothetical protein RUND412_007966 [Rhizina undulata]
MGSRANRRREPERYLLSIQQDTGYTRASAPSLEPHKKLMILNDEEGEVPNDAILPIADPLGLGHVEYPMCSSGYRAFKGDDSSLDVCDGKIEIKGARIYLV